MQVEADVARLHVDVVNALPCGAPTHALQTREHQNLHRTLTGHQGGGTAGSTPVFTWPFEEFAADQGVLHTPSCAQQEPVSGIVAKQCCRRRTSKSCSPVFTNHSVGSATMKVPRRGLPMSSLLLAETWACAILPTGDYCCAVARSE